MGFRIADTLYSKPCAFFGVQFYLEDMLGCLPVELVTNKNYASPISTRRLCMPEQAIGKQPATRLGLVCRRYDRLCRGHPIRELRLERLMLSKLNYNATMRTLELIREVTTYVPHPCERI